MSEEFEKRLVIVSKTREITGDEHGEWARRIEVEEKVTFWGERYTITPALVSTVWGDGKKWMYLTPLNTRPNYYVLRVDSRLDTDGWPDFADIVDDVYDAVEDEFGRHDDDVDEEEDPNGDDVRGWPAADFSVGSAWGELELDQESTAGAPG